MVKWCDVGLMRVCIWRRTLMLGVLGNGSGPGSGADACSEECRKSESQPSRCVLCLVMELQRVSVDESNLNHREIRKTAGYGVGVSN